MSAPGVLVLKVALAEVEPPIWRRFAVAGDTTLAELHDILQIVMGWQDNHLHEFRVGDERYGVPDPEAPDVKNERRKRVRGLERLAYRYDFGDDWFHHVDVERETDAKEFPRLPVCLEGARACPPEDCGGPWGYPDLLQALADPEDARHDELVEWLGGPFDPERFDLEAVNRELARW